MRPKVKMRTSMLILLVSCISMFAACSYITDFAVVNQSGQVVEIRYRIKRFPGPFAPPVAPATMAASRLSTKGGQEWKDLPSNQYRLDEENRTVIVELAPQQALRIARMQHYLGHEDVGDAEEFPVEEVIVTGAQGELRLLGQQARVMFSEMSKALYILTYR